MRNLASAHPRILGLLTTNAKLVDELLDEASWLDGRADALGMLSVQESLSTQAAILRGRAALLRQIVIAQDEEK